MYFTDRGIEELVERRGEETVTLEWVAERLRDFVDRNPEFETPIERFATWLARLDDDDARRTETAEMDAGWARSVYVAGLEPGWRQVHGGARRGRAALPPGRRGSACSGRWSATRRIAIVDLLRERYQVAAGRATASPTPRRPALLADGEPRGADRPDRRALPRGRAAGAARSWWSAPTSDGQPASRRARELASTPGWPTEFGSVVLPVVDGDDRSAPEVAVAVRAAYHCLAELGATVLAVIANRAPDARRRRCRRRCRCRRTPSRTSRRSRADRGRGGRTRSTPRGCSATTPRSTATCWTSWSARAHVPAFLDHLVDGALVITPGDRADLRGRDVRRARRPGWPSVAGHRAHPRRAAATRGCCELIERLHTGAAVFSVEPGQLRRPSRAPARSAGPTSAPPTRARSRPRWARSSPMWTPPSWPPAGRDAGPPRVTPLMFEYDLIDRARADRRHLVLPEGTEERILRAAEIAAAPRRRRPDAARPRRTRSPGGPASWASTSAGARRGRPGAPREWREEFADRVRRAARAQGRHRSTWRTTWSATSTTSAR